MYGTLTPNWPQAYWDEQKRGSAAGIGIPADAWIAALDGSWHERVSGLFGGLFETFRTVAGLAGHSPTDEQVALAVEQRCAAYRDTQQFRPDALETLRALRAAGLKIALVSDCTGELPAVWEATALAELFDTAVFSCVEGTRKPDPVLFRAAAQRLGVRPGQCLYVGDGGGDELHGSAAVGMLPVLLAAPDWVGSHAQGRRADAWTGLRAEALSEIPGLLETLRESGAAAAG
jgi:putative hydrolase of the HAD superfamily